MLEKGLAKQRCFSKRKYRDILRKLPLVPQTVLKNTCEAKFTKPILIL